MLTALRDLRKLLTQKDIKKERKKEALSVTTLT